MKSRICFGGICSGCKRRLEVWEKRTAAASLCVLGLGARGVYDRFSVFSGCVVGVLSAFWVSLLIRPGQTYYGLARIFSYVVPPEIRRSDLSHFRLLSCGSEHVVFFVFDFVRLPFLCVWNVFFTVTFSATARAGQYFRLMYK